MGIFEPSGVSLPQKLKENIELLLGNVPAEPTGFNYDKFLRTWRSNNFVQHVMPFARAYDTENGLWRFLLCDTAGRQIVRTITQDRLETITTFLANEIVPATGTTISAGEITTGFTGKTLLMESTGSLIFRVQFSEDGVNWYDFSDLTATAITWTINNTKRAIAVDDYSTLLRVVVQNTSAGDLLATVKMMSVV